MVKKKYIGKNGIRLTKKYLLKGMQYWAKDSNEAHKQLRIAKDEIKNLQKRIVELESIINKVER